MAEAVTAGAAATMAEAVTAGAAALLPGLPDEIVVWEILVRLPHKSILRCRAVCRDWRRTTSTRAFLLAHNGRQPSLPVVVGFVKSGGCYESIVTFDHRAAADAQIRPVARIDNGSFYCLQASCDGLLVLAASTTAHGACYSVWNPATRQRAHLRQPRDARLFTLLGVYLHRPSGEYRLLLYRANDRPSLNRGDPPERRVGCYVSALGSDQPPRYIPGPESASALCYDTPALVRDSLHFSPVQHQGESPLVTIFDTAAESFGQMRAPAVSTKSYIFEMDGKLGIYTYDDAMKVVHIWVLPDYECELWEYKHRVVLPVAEIREQCGGEKVQLVVSVVSTDGIVLLLLSHGGWLFYVDVDGKLVDTFHRDGQNLFVCRLQLKQTLVPHAFFTGLEDYTVNPFAFHLTDVE